MIAKFRDDLKNNKYKFTQVTKMKKKITFPAYAVSVSFIFNLCLAFVGVVAYLFNRQNNVSLGVGELPQQSTPISISSVQFLHSAFRNNQTQLSSNLSDILDFGLQDKQLERLRKILIEMTINDDVRKKMLRVFATPSFRIYIENEDYDYDGSPVIFDRERNAIIVYNIALQKLNIRSDLHVAFHQANIFALRNDGEILPFNNEVERSRLAAIIERCNTARTSGLNQLLRRKTHRFTDEIEKGKILHLLFLLKNYQPRLMPIIIPKTPTEVEKIQRAISQNKKVVVDGVYLQYAHQFFQRAIGWGTYNYRHSAELGRDMTFILAEEQRILKERELDAKYALKNGLSVDDTVTTKQDAKIHAHPELIKPLCPELENYHRTIKFKS